MGYQSVRFTGFGRDLGSDLLLYDVLKPDSELEVDFSYSLGEAVYDDYPLLSLNWSGDTRFVGASNIIVAVTSSVKVNSGSLAAFDRYVNDVAGEAQMARFISVFLRDETPADWIVWDLVT